MSVLMTQRIQLRLPELLHHRHGSTLGRPCRDDEAFSQEEATANAFGPAVASEDAVRKQYGIENEMTIEGPAGIGLAQDTSCYHHATPPTAGDRLMLAVRFIN